MFRALFVYYKGIITYLFFGVCTTAVNVIVYYLCAHQLHFSMGISTIVAWSLAVSVAYVTNKKWVFGSGSWKKSVIIREALSFIFCRLLTGVLDLVIMFVSVGCFGWDDLVMKLLSNVLVIILNYVASKQIIFRMRGRNI